MTAPAAIQGDYVDLKFIRTRKVAQIVVEIPMEQASAFMTAFGAPRPDGNVPVALARLDVKAPEPDIQPKDKTRAKEAGILCNDARFRAFINEQYPTTNAANAAEIIEFIRQYCEVKSRSHIDGDERASHIWDRLADRYYAWLQVAA